MEKDIYVLLNNVETDLEKYDRGEMETDEAKERAEEILRRLRKRKRKKMTAEKENVKGGLLKRIIRVAAVFVLVLLSAGGVVYAATDGEIFQEIFTMISGGAITASYISEEEGMVTDSVSATCVAKEIGESDGFPLLLEDGRLYFTGDGGKTDITDEISETEPYYIDVIDEEENTHKFVIGGRAEAGYYGYNEMLFDKNGKFRGGIGSFGENVMQDGIIRPEWYEKAWEEVMKTLHP